MSPETLGVIARFVGTLPLTGLLMWWGRAKVFRRTPERWRPWLAFVATFGVVTIVAGYGMAPTGSMDPVFAFAAGEYLPACLLWLALSLWRARQRNRVAEPIS